MEKINENAGKAFKEKKETGSAYKVWYEDSERIKITFTTLVIRVESINKYIGPLSEFAKRFALTGVTNGKLFLMAEMMGIPAHLNKLIETKFEPLGLIYDKDMYFTYDQPTVGVVDAIYPDINQELPECKNVSWLGSEISGKGCFVWLIKNV